MSRLSKRSASTPPHAPRNSVGTNCNAITAPMATPLLCDRSQHQPAERDRLHPRAAERDALADEEQPVVARAQRAEGGGRDAACGGHQSSSSCFEDGQRVGERGARFGRETRDALGEEHVLARAAALERLAAGVGDVARATIRRSCASTSRTASPCSSSRATMRVMLGGCTCSTAASSPRVIGPRFSMVASAARRDAVRSSPRAQRLLAHPAGEPGVGEAQPGRQHLRGDVRAWRGRRGWSRPIVYQTN